MDGRVCYSGTAVSAKGERRALLCCALELHNEAAERRPVRDALAPLGGAVAVGGGRRGGRGEALHHAALVAPAAGDGGRVVRVRRRRLLQLQLHLLAAGVPLPAAELAGGAHDLRVQTRTSKSQCRSRARPVQAS